MKKTIIDRYERTQNNQVIIDVSIQSVEHLYHDFDKTAPYHRKELDQEFVEYLTECVQEIRKHPFVIRISLEKMPDEILMSRVQKSVNSYYNYLKETEIRSLKLMLRRFIILFAIGLVFLVLAVLATRKLSWQEDVISEVFAQGLTIAAWISMWESLAILLLEWHPRRDTIRLYNRIICSPIVFRLCQ